MLSTITHSGVPNYKGCRVASGSNFNLTLWENKVKDYEDKHVNLLRFGFPLVIIERATLDEKWHIDNHMSAREFKPQVKGFIKKVLDLGVLLGPFEHAPYP